MPLVNVLLTFETFEKTYMHWGKKKMEKRNEWQECSRIRNSSREDIVSSIDCDLLFVERNTSTGNHLCVVRQ